MPMRSGGDTATVLQQIKTASETASRKQTDNGLTEKKETDIRLHQETDSTTNPVLDVAPSIDCSLTPDTKVMANWQSSQVWPTHAIGRQLKFH